MYVLLKSQVIIVIYTESEAKPRTSVNNNDNLRVQWDLSGFYPMLLMCMTMTSVHNYRLPLFFEVI